MDWKKEYRATDLFRRKKPSQPSAETPPTEAGPARPEPGPAGGAEGASVWKKEVKVSDLFRRSKKPAEETGPELALSDVAAGPARPEAETEPVPSDVSPEPVGAGLAPPEPAPEPEPLAIEAPVRSAPQPSAWKKEIKVSDLFRRGKKQAEEPGLGLPGVGAGPARPEAETGPVPSDVSPEPAPELSATETPLRSAPQPSAWKKEIKVSDLFRRRKKQLEEQPGFVEAVYEEPAEEPLEAQAPETEPAADAPEIAAELPAAAEMEHAPAEQELTEEPFVVEPPTGEPVADEPVEEPVAKEPAGAEPVASEPVDPELAEPGPVQTELYLPEPEPPVSAAREESVWKKEIKVSDLFRRGKKDADGPHEPASEPVGAGADGLRPSAGEASLAPTAPTESEPTQDAAPVPTSVWKKEIRLAPRRGPEPDKPAGREKPDRRARRERAGADRAARSDARGSKSTGGLPDVPLVRSINLLPRDAERTRSARLPSLATAGVALAGLLVLGGLAFAFLQARSRIDDRAGALEDLEAQVAAIQAPAQVAPEAGTQLAGEALARAGALTAALDGRFVWDRLLRKLSLVLPEGVWFETVQSAAIAPTVDPATALVVPGASATITINGYAKTQAGLAQLVGRLDLLPELGSVQLQSGALIERGGQDVFQFVVAATLERPTEA